LHKLQNKTKTPRQVSYPVLLFKSRRNWLLTDICPECFYKLQAREIPQHPQQSIPTLSYFAYIPESYWTFNTILHCIN